MRLKSRWLEVTTRIGCVNQCHYCPQDTLVSRYTGDKILTLERFRKLLSHIDKKTTQIHFSGFSESFLVDQAEHMMFEAYLKGFEILLFSTLVGFSQEKANFLKDNNMQFTSVRIHEYPMKTNLEKETFKENIETFKNAGICDDFEVMPVTNIASRGGSVFSLPTKQGALTCMRFECNVLLPNADVYLCCSDWGLKHKIGNLLEHHYDSYEFITARNAIRKQAKEPNSDILCRQCEWAIFS